MAEFKNAMEIFKLLNKSNCRQCGKTTCLAFAGAVFTGEKKLAECPDLAPEITAQYSEPKKELKAQEPENDDLEMLKQKISETDLALSAKNIGATFSNDRLTLKTLGKNISVDSKGNIITDIHVHGWITGPLFNYIIKSSDVPVLGNWVPFRELEGGKRWYRLFGQTCEKRLKSIADKYTNLFEDMMHLFNGKMVENHYSSDISLVLYPLPKLPMLICYWRPDTSDGFESELNMFFDANAEEILNIESIYTLGTGLVMMFEKISVRHGIT